MKSERLSVTKEEEPGSKIPPEKLISLVLKGLEISQTEAMH